MSYELWFTLEHKKARIRHGAAWISREIGDTETEKLYLAEALESYKHSYEKEYDSISNIEGTVCATIADILIRLDRPGECHEWFEFASQSDEARRNPALARQIRDRFREIQQAAKVS